MAFKDITCDHGEFTIFEVHHGEDSFSHIINDWNNYWSKVIDIVPNKNCVVQAGGHFGLYAIILSKMFNEVYTFEPENNNFHCLTVNCLKNVRPNIYKFEAALGATSGSTYIEHAYTSGQHRINHDGLVDHRDELFNRTFYIKKPILNIDSLCLESCDLIFLDLEGYEPYALIGALETIKKYRPVIFVENYFDGQEKLNSTLDMLINLYGYQYYTDIDVPNNRVLKYYD